MTPEETVEEIRALVDRVYTGQITSEVALTRAGRLAGKEGIAALIKVLQEDPRAQHNLGSGVT